MEPFIHWNQLSEAQREQVVSLRSDIPKWNLERMEYRFEYHKKAAVAGTRELKRVAARPISPQLPAILVELMEQNPPGPLPDDKYQETQRISTCPTYFTTTRD